MDPLNPVSDVLVARQPIYDSAMNVAAYELIVRDRDRGRLPSADSAAATSSTITEIGLSLVAGHQAFVKISRPFLLDGYAAALPSDRVVFEVRPSITPDSRVVGALEALVADGYTLCLQGFGHDEGMLPLLELAKVVKLDVRELDPGTLREQVSLVARHGVKLVAENVETHDELDFCQELGFDLYQGYFFCKPRVVNERGIQVNDMARLQLVAELQGPDVDFGALQEIISHDVGLSYNLLRFVNSAFFSLPRRVESLRDALVLLGLNNVRRWTTLMALASSQDKPHELLVTGLIRARMCELVAEAAGEKDREAYFTIGLFSVVDALMDSSMIEVLRSLPFSQEIIGALLNYDGQKGQVLHGVLSYERGDFEDLGALGALPAGASPSELYSQAVEWATQANGGLVAGEPESEAA
jgi:EAL and modified HD-GYP domain-containing signal transduction protein